MFLQKNITIAKKSLVMLEANGHVNANVGGYIYNVEIAFFVNGSMVPWEILHGVEVQPVPLSLSKQIVLEPETYLISLNAKCCARADVTDQARVIGVGVDITILELN